MHLTKVKKSVLSWLNIILIKDIDFSEIFYESDIRIGFTDKT